MPSEFVPQPQIQRRIVLVLVKRPLKRPVILEPQRHHLADVESGARPRLELPLVLRARQITLKRRVGSQLQATEPPLEHRGQLSGARALAELRSSGLELGAEPDIHGEPPRLGSAPAR